MPRGKKANTKTSAKPLIGLDRIEPLIAGIAPQEKTIEYTFGDTLIPIQVRTRLPLAERSLMVSEIANFCFVDGDYVPYMRDFGRTVSVLIHYTNIDVDSLGTDKTYLLTQCVDFYHKLYEAIDDDISKIFMEADQLVEWEKERLLHSSKADELYDAATRFVISLESQLDRITDQIAGNAENDDASVKDIIEAFKNVGKSDEAEIANAVLNYEEAKKTQAKRKVARKKTNQEPEQLPAQN